MSHKTYKPRKLGPRADMNRHILRQFMFKKGSRVLWQQSVRCPCVTLVQYKAGETRRATGEAVQQCPRCHGLGWFYHAQHEIMALVVAATKAPLFYQLYGEHARGMANLTFFPEHMAKAWDRVTVLDTVIPYSDVVPRTGDTQALRYPIRQKKLELPKTDLRIHERVETLGDDVVIFAADEFGQIGYEPLVRDTAYSIVDGKIVWLAGAPDEGSRISITCWINPVYVINDTPHPHRDTPVALKQGGTTAWHHLPLQMHAWLEHFGPPHGFS